MEAIGKASQGRTSCLLFLLLSLKDATAVAGRLVVVCWVVGGRCWWEAVENPYFFIVVFFPSMVKEQVACENETGVCFRFLFLFFFPVVVAPLMHLPEFGSDSRRFGGAVAVVAAATVTNARAE